MMINNAKLCTNGDKMRALMGGTDEELSKLLLWLNDMGELDERIHFCRNLDVCNVIIDTDEELDTKKCRECMLHWLGQPADKEFWRTVYDA